MKVSAKNPLTKGLKAFLRLKRPTKQVDFERALFNAVFKQADYDKGDLVMLNSQHHEKFAGLVAGGRIIFSDIPPMDAYFVKGDAPLGWTYPPAGAVKIDNWHELANVAESDTHRLEITPDDGNGWIVSKETGEYETYLSTHTFYGSEHERSSKLLQDHGFNVQLANWDDK